MLPLPPSTTPKPPRRVYTLIDRVLNYSEARAAYFSKVTPIDRFLAQTVLPLIPRSVTPNQITVFRFISIPFIVGLLITGNYTLATILFLFSAFSDAVDGALARTTKHITTWGTICDPLADKLLISSMVLLLVFKIVSPVLAIAMVTIEMLLIVSAYYRFKGKVVPAKLVGKIKMVLQCVGIIFLLYYLLSGIPLLLVIATYLLYGALVVALLSLFVYRSV